MAHIAWLHLCERAFLDNCDRLCVIGLVTRLPVPTIPIAVHQLMLVARVVDVRAGEEFEAEVSITAPSGCTPSPDDPHCVEIESAGEYLFVTLRQLPLAEEGVFRFTVSLVSGNALSVEIPVLSVSRPVHAQFH